MIPDDVHHLFFEGGEINGNHVFLVSFHGRNKVTD